MALPLLPMLLAAAPSIISGVGSLFGKKRRQQEEEKASQGISKMSDMYGAQLNGSYFDTGEAQGAINAFQNQQNEQNDEINATANVNGLTDEARIAMMGQNNKNSQGFFSNMSQQANLWRQRLMGQKSNSLGQLYQVGQQNRANQNNSMSNIVNPLQQGIDAGFTSGAFDGMFNKTAPGAANPMAGNISKAIGNYAAGKFKFNS